MGGSISKNDLMSGVYHSAQAELAEPVYDTNGVRNLSGCKADYTRVYGTQCGPFNWGASCCRPQMGINSQPTSGGYKNKNKNTKTQKQKQKHKNKNKKTKTKKQKQKQKQKQKNQKKKNE